MHVERLRLVGFKSFVDATELPIEPGLTGIVGPNGCGKSNLVEALRWLMGETSARRLRGGEMDDVIFGGTAGRPARNLAEVALAIDNSARTAPFAFNEREEIEVVRRIERGSGSSYRINGREVRARDVQLLFADAATGAHSGSLVGQGRVGELISARPAERRALLDEAAGTAGLQARRHEAELKLKSAEDNLVRLDDVVAGLEAQLESLKKQARQAQRYRRLAEQIRRTEAALLYARWRAAAAEAERAAAELRAAERDVAAATEAALAAEREREAAEAELPPLRLAEAEAAAKLQRLTHARESLEAELKRVLAARAEAEHRLGQADSDLRREDERLADAEAALARIAAERAAIELAERQTEAARRSAEDKLTEVSAALRVAETGLQQMTEACATAEARRNALDRQRREAAERRDRLRARVGDSERQRQALAASLVPPEATAAAAAAVAEAEAQAARRREEAEAAAAALPLRQAEEAQAVEAGRQAERRRGLLKTEADALEALLKDGEGGAETAAAPLLSQIRVPAGLEAAFGALFDDELTAPSVGPGAEGAAAGWVALGGLAGGCTPPAGARALAGEITAPPELERRVETVGLVDSAAEAWRLHPQLAAGQCLVDRDGRLWRWDGFVRLAARPSVAEQHLRQRNRLAVLRDELTAAGAAAAAAEALAATARAAREEAVAAERAAAAAVRQADAALAQARAAEAELGRRAVNAEAKSAALAEAIDKLTAELAEAEAQAVSVERNFAALPDLGLARAGLEAARAETAAARRREGEVQAELDRLARDATTRGQRLASLDGDEGSWRQRREGAAAQRGVLAERRTGLSQEIAALAARPAEIAAETEALAAASAAAAEQRRAAGDRLALAETRQRRAAEETRRAEQALAAAREQRARLDGIRAAAGEAMQRLRDDIRQRSDGPPERLAELAGLEPGASLSDLDDTAVRLDRLVRERENLGPVNLLAESEAAEVEARAEGLRRERQELTEAIARLRRGIATLDDEARKRVAAAFERLNEHFATLFTRLFGGGRAHLALEADADPLNAGLDIMASPPGKRLQTLSLLSGGEQALTAIALLFAVFLTQPAPICVLDEVDAPLDDANVDRFCRLVAEMADTTGTRFLVVTHHRVTMARMDRLFGVTMVERGVSQLVSVDLARANQLRQTA